MDSDKSGMERLRQHFADEVRSRFAFLSDLGFTEIEATLALVRFQNLNGDVEVGVYYERQSYEPGITVTHGGISCSLGQMIRVVEPQTGKEYRDFAVTTESGLTEGLERLVKLTKRYGQRAIQGDLEFYADLEIKRKSWVHEYALDVLVNQLRPKAEEAFRRGDYRNAAELYERIRSRLTAAELKKLAIATERDRA